MSMKKDNLDQLFVDGLKDLYDAEHQILEALPKMAEMASSTELRQAFQMHEQQTRQQVRRLEKVFQEMRQRPDRKKCVGMEGIIHEGQQHMKEYRSDRDLLDAAMLASAQKVEHYEISGYGTSKTYAQMLGMQNAAQLLDQTLKEEYSTDERLTHLAENFININAEM
jgi:ferritin-like metal-binding protein YciE